MMHYEVREQPVPSHMLLKILKAAYTTWEGLKGQ